MNDRIPYRRSSGMLLLLLLIFSVTRAQKIPLSHIEHAMREGDVRGLADYFGKTVDISLNNSQSTYSRVQAQMILRDFFSRNAVRSYDPEHTAESSSGREAMFTIGHLVTSGGKYRVYMYLRQRAQRVVLEEIRIEK